MGSDLLAPPPAGSSPDLMDYQSIPSRSHQQLVQDRLDGLVFLR